MREGKGGDKGGVGRRKREQSKGKFKSSLQVWISSDNHSVSLIITANKPFE